MEGDSKIQRSSALISPSLKINARFSPPRLIEPLVKRDHLLSQTDRHIGRVCLLLGGTGSGKTFALAGFYEALVAQGQRCAWLSLDKSDDDAQILTQHIEEAFTHTGDSPQCLFIDGAEKLNNTQAWSALETFLLALPTGTTAFVTAQSMRRTAFYDAWLRGVVTIIGPDLLNMSANEARAILPAQLCDADCENALRFVHGWPAGLRILALHPEYIERLSQNDAPQGSALPDAMASYFEDVVVPRLDATEYDALTVLSVLDRFTPAMLRALAEPGCDWNLVEALIREQSYVRPLDPQKYWHQIQPALGRFLEARLRHGEPERYERLKEFAASWCAEHSFPAEAVRHTSQMSDQRRAAEIIEQAGAITVELGEGPDLDFAMDLPPQSARDLPLLFFSQIYHRIRHGRHRQARMAYDKAHALTAGFTDIGPHTDPHLVAAWAHLFKIILASIEDATVPLEDIQLAERFQAECLEPHPVLAASYASVIAWAYIELGYTAEANRVCQTSFAPQGDDSTVRVSLFLHVHWVSLLLMQDTVANAILHIEQAQALAQLEPGEYRYEVLIPQIKRGVMHYEQSELEEARACLLPALERLRNINGWVRIYAEGITTAFCVEMALGNIEGAEAVLRAGEQFAQTRSLSRLSAILTTTRAMRAIAQEDFRYAQSLLASPPLEEIVKDTSGNGRNALVAGPALLAQALLGLELKRPREALETLDRVVVSFTHNPDARLRFSHKVLAMRAHFALRRYNGAVECLLDALAIAQTTGLVQRTLENRTDLVEVYEWAKRNGKSIPTKIELFYEQVLGATHTPTGTLRTKPVRNQTWASNLTLSPREAEIMTLVAEGLSAKEIALRLGISEGTVKSHRKKTHGKLGVSTRSQAILKARELLII